MSRWRVSWSSGGAGVALADVGEAGNYRTSVSVEVPAYYGIEPIIGLHYDSMAGNGSVGVGWQLAAGSTVRRLSRTYGAPRYDLTDVFFLDGRELIACTPGMVSPSCQYGGNYAFRTETFERVLFDPSANAWTVTAKSGVQRRYIAQLGNTTTSLTTYRWALSTVTDPRQHVVTYSYQCDGPNDCYPSVIQYGDGLPCRGVDLSPTGARIRLFWEPRADPVTAAIGGALQVTSLRLHSIDVMSANTRVRAFQLGYAQSTTDGSSLLSSLDEVGSDGQLATNGTITGGTHAPLRTFSTQSITPAMTPGPVPPTLTTAFDTTPTGPTALPATWTGQSISQPRFVVTDVDGDGRVDIVTWSFDSSAATLTLTAQMPNGTSQTTTMPWLAAAPQNAIAADVNGDGLHDLIFQSWVPRGTSTYNDMQMVVVLASGGGTFVPIASQVPVHIVGGNGNPLLYVPTCTPIDVNGDGRDDFACTSLTTLGIDVVVEVAAGGSSFSEADWAGPSGTSGVQDWLVATDLDNDGHQDLEYVRRPLSAGDPWTFASGLSLGTGEFTWEVQTTSQLVVLGPAVQSISVQAGDLDGDGRGDVLVAVSNFDGSATVTFAGLNRSTGSARWQFTMQTILNMYATVSLGDADGDNIPNLMVAEYRTKQAAANCGVTTSGNHLDNPDRHVVAQRPLRSSR